MYDKQKITSNIEDNYHLMWHMFELIPRQLNIPTISVFSMMFLILCIGIVHKIDSFNKKNNHVFVRFFAVRRFLDNACSMKPCKNTNFIYRIMVINLNKCNPQTWPITAKQWEYGQHLTKFDNNVLELETTPALFSYYQTWIILLFYVNENFILSYTTNLYLITKEW